MTEEKQGNRTSVTNGGTTDYNSNNLNQYTTVGDANYSYDDNGNMTRDDNLYYYYYDCENRLTHVNDMNGSAVASYKYDFAGRRVEKLVYDSNETTKYCYDGDQVIAEYDGNDTLLRKFVYGSGIDEPICMIDVADSDKVYYYHFDGLGSVVALSDVNSVIVERYSYDVYGEPTIRDANGDVISESNFGNPYMFTGRRYDIETGLYYYRARYYHPEIGRFIQTDPVGYRDGLNLYTYVLNNPVNSVDPSGKGIWGCIKAIIGVIRVCPLADLSKVIEKAKELENKWIDNACDIGGGAKCMPSYPSCARAEALASEEFKEWLRKLGKCGLKVSSALLACGLIALPSL